MEQYNYMPIGTVVSFAGATTPIGWLLCDGREITESQYPDLYKIVGNRLPDLRGEFVRGLDAGRGVDGGRTLGSTQGDNVGEHDHAMLSAINHLAEGTGNIETESLNVGLIGKSKAYRYWSNTKHAKIYGENHASLATNPIGENRPRNIALNQIIKAFNTTTDTETLPIQMAKALNNKIENNYNDQLDATVDIVGKEFYDYIQNSGEKTAGKIYRDRLQKGIFRCLETTISVINDSKKFVNISSNERVAGMVDFNKRNTEPAIIGRYGDIDDYVELTDLPYLGADVRIKKSGLYTLSACIMTGNLSSTGIGVGNNRFLVHTNLVKAVNNPNVGSGATEIIDFYYEPNLSSEMRYTSDTGTYSKCCYIEKGDYFIRKYNGSSSVNDIGFLQFSISK